MATVTKINRRNAGYTHSQGGWLFPVGDEVAALGYIDMFGDMPNGSTKLILKHKQTGKVSQKTTSACR